MTLDKVIFVDRDGTLIKEVHYLSKKEDIQFYEDVPRSLVKLKKAGFKLIIITNQSGVARGYFPEKFVGEAFDAMNSELKQYNVAFDAQYYCPHHPEIGVEKYKVDCDCRKPSIGMIQQADKDFNIDYEKSYMLGDKLCDIQLGKDSGLTGILLETGHGKDNIKKVQESLPNTLQFQNFGEATRHILSLNV